MGGAIHLRQEGGGKFQEWIKISPKQSSVSSFVPVFGNLAVLVFWLVSDAREGKVSEADMWTCHHNEAKLRQQWSGLAVLVLPGLEWFHSLIA